MSEWRHLIEKHQAALDSANHIFTWTAKDELAWLAEEASRRMRILEIGTYLGHSAIVLARSTKGTVTCFDLCNDKGVPEQAAKNLAGEDNIRYNQRDAGVSAVREYIEGKMSFDMIWIDDGHAYQDVVRDILSALLLRSPNAIICGHDYERPANDVARAVDDCFGVGNVKFGPGRIWYI